MGKKGLPCITDRFTERTKREIKAGDLEGKLPGRTTLYIGNGYKINTQGQVIGLKNIPLTPIFRKGKRSPFVIIKIKIKDTDGKPATKDKEKRIDNLMEIYFGPHIEGYSEKILHQEKEYIVVPKDGNWKYMSLGNIEYVVKKEYNLNGTTKALLMHLIPFFDSKSDEELAQLLGSSRGWVSRVKSELKETGKIGDETLNKLIISHSTYKIHVALLACKGLKSNLDIVRELRPDADLRKKEERDSLADKVTRVRKKLFDKGFIEKYNTYQKKVNIADVREELEKMLMANKDVEKGKRKTHAEIAETFGLGKEQVDNFSRQIAKKRGIGDGKRTIIE